MFSSVFKLRQWWIWRKLRDIICWSSGWPHWVSEGGPRAGPGPSKETLGLSRKHLQWLWQSCDPHTSLGKELQVGMHWCTPEAQRMVRLLLSVAESWSRAICLSAEPLLELVWAGADNLWWEAFQLTFVLKFTSLHYLANFILALFAQVCFCHHSFCRVVSVCKESHWCTREWPTLELRNYTGISSVLRKAYGLSYDTWEVIHSFQWRLPWIVRRQRREILLSSYTLRWPGQAESQRPLRRILTNLQEV